MSPPQKLIGLQGKRKDIEVNTTGLVQKLKSIASIAKILFWVSVVDLC